MTTRTQTTYKSVRGQGHAVDFWRVSFGDVGDAHGFRPPSNINAQATPPLTGKKLGVLQWRLQQADLLRSVWPVGQAATDQNAQSTRDRVRPTVNRNPIGVIAGFAADLVSQRYK